MSTDENDVKDLILDHMRANGIDVDHNEPDVTMLAPPSLTLYKVEGHSTGREAVYVLAHGHTRAISIARTEDPDLDQYDAFAAPIAEVSYNGITPGVVDID